MSSLAPPQSPAASFKPCFSSPRSRLGGSCKPLAATTAASSTRRSVSACAASRRGFLLLVPSITAASAVLRTLPSAAADSDSDDADTPSTPAPPDELPSPSTQLTAEAEVEAEAEAVELGADHGERGVERVAVRTVKGQVTKLCPEASPPAREHAGARSLACTSETSEHLEPQFIGEAAEPVLPIGVATPGTGPRHASSRRRHQQRRQATAGSQLHDRGSSTETQSKMQRMR